MSRQQIGKVHLYTGDGKGKTTAAVGLAVRALGRGMKVAFWQLLKPHGGSGEELLLGSMQNVKWCAIGRPGFVHPGELTAEEFASYKTVWEEIKKDMASGEYGMVVVDELTHVVSLGLLLLDVVLEGIKCRDKSVELVMTGSNAPLKLIKQCDYVTDMHCRRHPFRLGFLARKGIEY